MRCILVLIIFSCAATQLGCAEGDGVDHYAALGISRDSTLKQIRRAYRKLSVKWHPDKHAGKPTLAEATERFQQISAAYEVIGDEDKRVLYDDYGDEKFYSKEAAQAAGHSSTKGFYANNKNIVALESWMFAGWTFQGERAHGPLQNRDAWLLEFYAPWCTHCQEMAPAFKRAAARLSDVVGFGAANCEEDEEVCQSWRIASYPTLVFIHQSEQVQEVYEGPHDADSLVTYLREMSTNAVEELTPAVFLDKVYDSTYAWFVLFNAGQWCGPCIRAKPMFRKFSGQIHPHAKAGTVDCDRYGDFCNEYNVESYPHYLSFTPGGSKAGDAIFGSHLKPGAGLDLIAKTVKMMAASMTEAAEAREEADYIGNLGVHEGL